MTLKRRFLRALPTTTATDELQTILRRKWPCQSFSCPTDNSRLKTLLAIYTTDPFAPPFIVKRKRFCDFDYVYIRNLMGIDSISS